MPEKPPVYRVGPIPTRHVEQGVGDCDASLALAHAAIEAAIQAVDMGNSRAANVILRRYLDDVKRRGQLSNDDSGVTNLPPRPAHSPTPISWVDPMANWPVPERRPDNPPNHDIYDCGCCSSGSAVAWRNQGQIRTH